MAFWRVSDDLSAETPRQSGRFAAKLSEMFGHEIHLYAATSDGARRLDLPRDTVDLHAVLDDAPLGIYEGFRTFEHGRFLRLERHLDRAQASLRATGRERVLDRGTIHRALQQAADEWKGENCRIRLDVLDAPALALGHDGDILFVLSDQPARDPEIMENGVRVGVARGMRRDQPRAKTAQWVVDRRACSPEYYENLLLDTEDRVLECTSSNFFAVRDGTLITAPDGVLEGVTRGVALDVARELEIPREHCRLPLDELGQVDEAFLSSASRGLIPIVEIAGRPVGDGRPGPTHRRLFDAAKRLVEREARPAWPQHDTTSA